MPCLFSQLPFPNWESLFQLGFAATVAIYMLWNHTAFAKRVEQCNRLNAISGLTTQKFTIHMIDIMLSSFHDNEKPTEFCATVKQKLDMMDSELDKQREEFERELTK